MSEFKDVEQKKSIHLTDEMLEQIVGGKDSWTLEDSMQVIGNGTRVSSPMGVGTVIAHLGIGLFGTKSRWYLVEIDYSGSMKIPANLLKVS